MSDSVTVAHDARRQLRALRGDEAPARLRAGAAHRRRVRRGDPAAREAPRSRSTALAVALLEKETLLRDELVALLGDVERRVARLRDRRHAARRLAARVARPVASPPWRRGASIISASPSRTSTRRSTTYERLFGAELEHRDTVDEQGVEAASVRVGESRVELLAPLGDDTPVGRFLAKRGPGMHHVAYEVDDLRAALAELDARGRRADRRRAARRPLRARGRVRPSRLRPRRPRGGGVRCR